jgi:hypothetical protein
MTFTSEDRSEYRFRKPINGRWMYDNIPTSETPPTSKNDDYPNRNTYIPTIDIGEVPRNQDHDSNWAKLLIEIIILSILLIASIGLLLLSPNNATNQLLIAVTAGIFLILFIVIMKVH